MGPPEFSTFCVQPTIFRANIDVEANHRMTRKSKLQAVTALFLAGTIALASQNKLVTVTLEGQPITKNGRIINGKLYIPADEAAKAFGHKLEYKSGASSAKFVLAGGANPEQGADGIVDEWLFNGITRLMLMSNREIENGKVVFMLEVRNAERASKIYRFGFSEAQFLLFDAKGNQVTVNLMELNKDYSVDVKPATPYRVRYGCTFPDGFEPIRAVIRIPTQIQGNPMRIELFRVNLNVKA